MSAPFHTTRFVEFSDTDMAGIVHFSAFFRYMESAEHALVRSIGFSVYSEIDGEVVTFPRVAVACEYHSPIRCEDVLDIAVSVLRVGTKSVTYGFAFSHDGREVATGKVTAVCCRIMGREPPRPIPIPAPLADKLRAFETAVS
jgi:acyl-CoA thioester hydrolase